MSNGFYCVPATLYALLEQQAQGSGVDSALKKIVNDFIARNDAPALINNYAHPQPYQPKALNGDAFDYPTFWRHVDKAALDAAPGTSRDKVVSAALKDHFKTAATPYSGPDANALDTGLPVPIEKELYARIRKQSLDSGKSIATLIAGCVERYLDECDYKPLLRHQVGTTLTIFSYRPTARQLARIDAVLHLHHGPMQRTDRRDIVALAIAEDFRRQDLPAEARVTATARRQALLRPDPRFKL